MIVNFTALLWRDRISFVLKVCSSILVIELYKQQNYHVTWIWFELHQYWKQHNYISLGSFYSIFIHFNVFRPCCWQHILLQYAICYNDCKHVITLFPFIISCNKNVAFFSIETNQDVQALVSRHQKEVKIGIGIPYQAAYWKTSDLLWIVIVTCQ